MINNGITTHAITDNSAKEWIFLCSRQICSLHLNLCIWIVHRQIFYYASTAVGNQTAEAVFVPVRSFHTYSDGIAVISWTNNHTAEWILQCTKSAEGFCGNRNVFLDFVIRI